MTQKRTNPSNLYNPYAAKPYDWDYPSQGLRFHRTLEEAFGPGARLTVRRSYLTQTHVAYAFAIVIFSITLVMLFTKRL
jgi:hypothetical protein